MAVPKHLLEAFPSIDEIRKMTSEDVIALLAEYGVAIDEGSIEDAARAMFARAKAAIRDGVALETAAEEQLSASIMRGFDVALRENIRAIMGDWRNTVIGGQGVDQEELWVAVMDTSTCNDCEERHGSERTRGQWEQVGLPRSSALICKRLCRCELFPVSGDAPQVYVEVASL